MMSSAVELGGRLVLASVFLVAGVTKLRDGFSWIRQAHDMGVPPRISSAVPWIEVVLAVSLIVGWPGRWPLFGALALLLGFTSIIILRIADGSRPPCGCFGKRSTRNLGWRDVVRNLLLTSLALALILFA